MEGKTFEHEPGFERIIRDAARAAYDVHEALGEEGEKRDRENRFDEETLRADWECEEAVLSVLRASGIPMRVIAEEHGDMTIGEGTPLCAVFLDGLDGSNRYLAGRGKLRYGTMIGFAKGADPRFKDCFMSAIMEHSTGKLFFGERGKGVWVEDMGNSPKREPLKVAAPRTLREARIYLDIHWPVNREAFADPLTHGGYAFNPGGDLRSFATYFSDLASGKADLVLFCTGKEGIEFKSAYAMIKEAGGVVLTLNGETLDEEKCLSFGSADQVPLIAASNEKLARDMVQYLKDSSPAS